MIYYDNEMIIGTLVWFTKTSESEIREIEDFFLDNDDPR
jgi:hypothetical protein